jgi:hypothetical protein
MKINAPTPLTKSHATFARAGNAEIRSANRLRCNCGAWLKALDVAVEEDGSGIKHVKAICPNCHSDLFEVTL